MIGFWRESKPLPIIETTFQILYVKDVLEAPLILDTSLNFWKLFLVFSQQKLSNLGDFEVKLSLIFIYHYKTQEFLFKTFQNTWKSLKFFK